MLPLRHSRRLNSSVSNLAKHQKNPQIAAYGTHCTYCSEPSNTNALWYAIQLLQIPARICMEQHIFQTPEGRLFFRVLQSQMCHLVASVLTLAKETSQQYALLTNISCKSYNEDLPKSVDVKLFFSQTDFACCLDVSTYCIGAIFVLITSCHGNTSADFKNNQRQRILLHFTYYTMK